MPGIAALTKIFDLIIAGVNDTGNALGEDSLVGKLGAYGDLLPNILQVIGSVKQLPTEVKDLDSGEAGQLIDHVAKKLDLPGEKADAIVRAGAVAANAVLQTVAAGVKDVGVAIKQNKDAAAGA